MEHVVSGDRMIVRMMPSTNSHLQSSVLVTGIRAPATRRITSDGKEQPAEPYGPEAQRFMDFRLRQRIVHLKAMGTSPQNQLICSVMHPNGDMAEFILKAGLAKCNDHHSTILGSDMIKLRAAEKVARDQGLGLFKGASTSKAIASETDATVTRIQSPDSVYLRDRSGAERRVYLSSIRQPKPTDTKQKLFLDDAKEFLRKRVIGKHVRFTVDGKKPASEGHDEREVVTIKTGNKNVALQMVEAGYASAIRHKRDAGICFDFDFPSTL